jgi:hypothetical protein
MSWTVTLVAVEVITDQRIRDNRRVKIYSTASETRISHGRNQYKNGLKYNLKYFLLME